MTRPTAEELAKHFAVYNYDRRGDGGDTAPHPLEREIEDLAALIAEAGPTASVYAYRLDLPSFSKIGGGK